MTEPQLPAVIHGVLWLARTGVGSAWDRFCRESPMALAYLEQFHEVGFPKSILDAREWYAFGRAVDDAYIWTNRGHSHRTNEWDAARCLSLAVGTYQEGLTGIIAYCAYEES